MAQIYRRLRGLGRRFRRDRRGVSTIVLAVSAVVLLGFGGLALDGGLWYLNRRAAQNAADAAAQSGALILHRQLQTPGVTRTEAEAAARAAAIDVAARNNFPIRAGTEVQVNIPPVAPARPEFRTNTRVQVIIRQQQPLFLSGLLLSSAPTTGGYAVAGMEIYGDMCALATRQLTFSGNITLNAPGCVLYANGQGGSPAYRVQGGSADVTAAAVFTTDSVCPPRSPGTPCVSDMAPAPLPADFQALLNFPSPTFTSSGQQLTRNCLDRNPGNRGGEEVIDETGIIRPTYGTNGTGRAWCGNTQGNTRVVIGANNTTTTMSPGVYFFQNANLSFAGTVICNGCAFVFTGTAPGGIRMSGNETVQLTAPANGALSTPSPLIGTPWGGTTPSLAPFEGFLFYRACTSATAACASASTDIVINGTTASTLNGAMFFPNANVRVNGTGRVDENSCNPIIARDLTFSGNADYEVRGCGAAGLDPGQAFVLRLLE